jgi:hypothetical protein
LVTSGKIKLVMLLNMSDKNEFSVEDSFSTLIVQAADVEKVPTEPMETISIIQLPREKFMGDDVMRVQAMLNKEDKIMDRPPVIHGFFGINDDYKQITDIFGIDYIPETYSFEGRNYHVYTVFEELRIRASALQVYTVPRHHDVKIGDFILFEINPKRESIPIHEIIPLIEYIRNVKNIKPKPEVAEQ